MRALIVGSLLCLIAILFFQDPSRKGSSVQTKQSASSESKDGETKKDDEMVSVQVFDEQGKLVGPIAMPKVVKTEAEWKELLTAEQFTIARQSGTERAFCGTLLDNKKKGVYTCVCCNLPLFSSDAKFNSGTGWPSFFQPIAKENVAEKADYSHGMTRVEINCARCDAHLGHVFPDGPKPTGQRHCLNSESLKFTDEDKLKELADPAAKEK